MTTHLPALAFRSAATAAMNACCSEVQLGAGIPPPLTATATASTRLAFIFSRWSALKPVHLDGWIHQLATICIIARQLDEAWMGDAGEEIRIERQNDICLVQHVLRVVEITERGLRGAARGVAIHRVVLDQLCLRVALLVIFPLPGKGGRGDGRAQDVETLSARHICQVVNQRLLEIPKRSRLQVIERVLRAVRIVEAQQRTLTQGV